MEELCTPQAQRRDRTKRPALAKNLHHARHSAHTTHTAPNLGKSGIAAAPQRKRARECEPFLVISGARNYIIPGMPPIPPIPPISGIPPAPPSSGASATIASVVIIKPATEPAACNAVRVTLAGSRIPIASMSP